MFNSEGDKGRENEEQGFRVWIDIIIYLKGERGPPWQMPQGYGPHEADIDAGMWECNESYGMIGFRALVHIMFAANAPITVLESRSGSHADHLVSTLCLNGTVAFPNPKVGRLSSV